MERGKKDGQPQVQRACGVNLLHHLTRSASDIPPATSAGPPRRFDSDGRSEPAGQAGLQAAAILITEQATFTEHFLCAGHCSSTFRG